ncbi:MAG: VWA domain-containing protein, partial [Dietzia sp.]
GFDVDGMRADIVTARTAAAHAAWQGRVRITREDIRVAALMSLPHRRRRAPFDAPGLDEELLERLLGDDDEPDPDPRDDSPTNGTDPADSDEGATESSPADAPDAETAPAGATAEHAEHDSPADHAHRAEKGSEADAEADADRDTTEAAEDRDYDTPPEPFTPPAGAGSAAQAEAPQPGTVVSASEPYRTRLFSVAGTGEGTAGRRSRAITTAGRRTGSSAFTGSDLHLPATIRAAAPFQAARGRVTVGSAETAGGPDASAARGPDTRLRLEPRDLRSAVREGRESNLVLFCVDASGSMAARTRMEQVKTAILSLLLDAYRRRDKVGLVTFRGSGAEVALPPTSSVDIAATRLAELPAGGRTPLAEGLLATAEVLRIESIRDRRRRPLVVVVTDGRATHGPHALARSHRAAAGLAATGVTSVVVDCETGRFRMGLAADLAAHLGAEHLALGEVTADGLTRTVRAHTAPPHAAAPNTAPTSTEGQVA